MNISSQMLVACIPAGATFLDHGKMAGVVVAGLELQAAQKRLLHEVKTLNRVVQDVTFAMRGNHHG